MIENLKSTSMMHAFNNPYSALPCFCAGRGTGGELKTKNKHLPA